MHALLLLCTLLQSATPADPAQDDGRGWRWSTLDLDLWIEPDLGDLHFQGAGELVLTAESSRGPKLLLNGALLELESVASPGATVELGRETVPDAGELATARVRFAQPKA